MIIKSSDEFIANYDKLKSSRKMAELYNCDKATILNYAKKIGYDVSNNQNNNIKSYTAQELYTLYVQFGSIQKVAEFLKCSATGVSNKLKKAGYQLNLNKKLNELTVQQFIDDYFEVQSIIGLSKKYSCSTTAIQQYIKRHNLNIQDYKLNKITESDKQYIISQYYTKTSGELSKEYNVSRGIITKIWYDAGLSGKTVIEPITNALDLTGKTFGFWTVLEKTEQRNAGGSIYWKCKCEKCGKEKNVLGTSLYHGYTQHCGCTNNFSKGNEKINNILLSENIPFVREKRFNTCKDINYLPFDFFVDNKYIIEYDGIQHFPNSPTLYDYETTHRHDIIKNQWCFDNNIPIIRIPYTHFDKITIKDLQLETSQFILIMPTLNP